MFYGEKIPMTSRLNISMEWGLFIPHVTYIGLFTASILTDVGRPFRRLHRFELAKRILKT